MTKLLVVDDSALMRKFFRDLYAEEARFELAFARNGREALEQLHSFQPDVITLDVNMPEMDGLSALSEIMVQRPTPVLMVSSLTQRDALVTLEALALGALDYIAKPGGTISLGMSEVAEDLKSKVRMAARSRVRRRPDAVPVGGAAPTGAPAVSRPATPATLATPRPAARPAARPQAAAAVPGPATRQLAGDPEGVILIGVSTGGPRALEDVLPALPADLAWPVVVAQHMPAMFTRSFAQRMDQLCSLTVVEADNPMVLEQGCVYVARGSADAILVRRAGRLCVAPRPEEPSELWHPSVRLLTESAMRVMPADRLVAVMLTGMGHDGADAMAELKRRGGRTLAESEETAVVYGMPGELVRRGGATRIVPLQDVAGQVLRWVGRAVQPASAAVPFV